jgi:glucokinase
MQEQKPRSQPLTAREICELARQGDQLALRCMEREARYVGFGLANLVTLFSPDLISLGGGLMHGSDLFLDSAIAFVRDVCTQVPVHKTRIVPTALGGDAGILGAAQCWLHRHPSSELSAHSGVSV